MPIIASAPLRRWREPALIGLAFALCVLGGALRSDGTLSAPTVTSYIIAAVSCAALVARQRHPLPALAVTVASAVLAPALGLWLTPLIVVPAAIAIFSVASRSRHHLLMTVALTSLVLLVASAPVPDAFSWQDASRMASIAMFPVVAAALGQSVRDRRAYLEAMEDRARRAEESREREARQRVADERLSISRELHDVVAHQITLANAQANVAALTFDSDPDQARTSLRELVVTTRDALDEMRATVGLLRQPGSPDDSHDPAPSLERLPVILSSFRRTGLDVSAENEGRPRPVPVGIDLIAYRIVQEALTNVTKHAADQRAALHLGWHPDHLTITVTDGALADSSGRTRHRQTPPDQPPMTTGYGLIGMRERVAAVGGRLTAGPVPGDGFTVCAELPLPTDEETR